MDSGRLFFDPLSCGNTLFFGNGDSVFRGTRSVMNMGETLRSRPLFSPPEELFDEENYDEQSLEKKRRLTPEQVHLLEKSFELENKLEPERKTELAKKLGMQPRQVAVWFQNRRARWKTKQLEREFDRLKSSYESLLSDCKFVSKENEKLRAEVVSLTEKLAGAPISCPKQEPHPTEVPIFPPLRIDPKAEDRLSTGTGGSAVVDEDGRQLMDSGNSYFLNCDYPAFVAPVGGFQSEEEEGYFSDAFPAVKQFPEEGEPLGSWVWS